MQWTENQLSESICKIKTVGKKVSEKFFGESLFFAIRPGLWKKTRQKQKVKSCECCMSNSKKPTGTKGKKKPTETKGKKPTETKGQKWLM